MRTVQLGESNIEVPIVGMGMMGIGGYFHRDESRDEAFVERLRQGIELGATFIDTAEGYGAGHCEELLGKAIAGRRHNVIIATKLATEHSARADAIAAAEGSLKRIGVDYIDLYQTHWPNPSVPFEETLESFTLLLEQGKIRAVGLSNATHEQLQLAKSVLPARRLVSLQQQYNLGDRFVEKSFLPVCRSSHLSLIAYSPLLEGKIAPEDSRFERLLGLAEKESVSVGQLVLAWLLRHPEVIVIPKAAASSHLKENIAAADISLSAETIMTIDELYSQNVIELAPCAIEVAADGERTIYRTLEEALQNSAQMTPSPLELSRQFLAGEAFKPIKVRRDPSSSGGYILKEGRLRYWAWVIAYDGKKPIQCVVV